MQDTSTLTASSMKRDRACLIARLARLVMLLGFLLPQGFGRVAFAETPAPDDAVAQLQSALADELGFRDVVVDEQDGRVSIAFRPATEDEDELHARLLVAVLAAREFVPDSREIQVILHKEGLPVGILDVPTSSVKALLEGKITADAFFDSWRQVAFPTVVEDASPEIRLTPGNGPDSSDDSPRRGSDAGN